MSADSIDTALARNAIADRLYLRRRIVNGVGLAFATASTAFGLFWLAWILWTTFSNGIAANPCTYASYDAAGNIINTGSFNSYSQASPQAAIDRNTTLFRTSGCTPWALTHPLP